MTETRKTGSKKEKKTSFKCSFCQEGKPLEEMRLSARFFPPLVMCRDCQQKNDLMA